MKLDDLCFRDGCESDVPAMYALDLECFSKPFRFDRRSMRHLATAAGSNVRVAEVPGSNVAMAGFAILEVGKRCGEMAGYVITLDVALAFRRIGLGLRLLHDVEHIAAGKGARTMGLHVFGGNPGAIGLYERAGYGQVGLIADFYGLDLHALVYEKRLG